MMVWLRGTSTGHCKLTVVEVVATSSHFTNSPISQLTATPIYRRYA